MSLDTPTMPEQIENLKVAILVYAMAVHNMRRLQLKHEEDESLVSYAEMLAAETEVDAMTERIIVPQTK